jgi:hypothetical protein
VPLTVQFVVKAGSAAVLSIDNDPPDEHDAFRCVTDALARLSFPNTGAPTFHTLVL